MRKCIISNKQIGLEKKKQSTCILVYFLVLGKY